MDATDILDISKKKSPYLASVVGAWYNEWVSYFYSPHNIYSTCMCVIELHFTHNIHWIISWFSTKVCDAAKYKQIVVSSKVAHKVFLSCCKVNCSSEFKSSAKSVFELLQNFISWVLALALEKKFHILSE